MRRYAVLDGAISMERLDPRLSLTSLLLGGSSVSPIYSSYLAASDDPLPSPEPSPGPDPGTSTPIITPPIRPSGPIGPGTT